MRIERIEITSLASLRGEQPVIDLINGPFGEAGIIAVTGPTGAGKSTVFDAVCLALFGETPRLRKQGQDPRELMSRGASMARVAVTLGLDDGRHLTAIWQVHRSRNRVDGTLQSATVELYDEARPGSPLVTGVREVQAFVQQALSLTFDQFRSVAMLSQGEFARFLTADENDRSALLEKLTGTGIYTRLGKAAHEKHKQLAGEISDLEHRLGGITVLDDAALIQLRADAQQAATAAEASGQALDQAIRRAQWWHRLCDLNKHLSEALSLETRATQDREANVPKWQQLEAAKRAQAVAGELARAAQTREQVAGADRALATARTILTTSEQERATRLAALIKAAAEAQALAGAIAAEFLASTADDVLQAAVLQDLTALQSRVGAAQQQAALATQALKTSDQQVASARAEVETRRPALDQAQQALEVVRQEAAQAEKILAAAAAQGDVGALTEQQQGLRQAAELVGKGLTAHQTGAGLGRNLAARDLALTQVETQQVQMEQLLTAARTAAQAQDEAYQRQLQLARLADFRDLLVEAQPCPLCGALEHPKPIPAEPAALVSEAKTLLAKAKKLAERHEKDHQEAQQRTQQARSACDLARHALATHDQAVVETRAAWERLRGRMVDLPVDVLKAEVAPLMAQVDDCTRRIADLRAAQKVATETAAKVRAQDEVLGKAREALTKAETHLAAVQGEVVRRQQELVGSERALTQARMELEAKVADLASKLGETAPAADQVATWITALNERARRRQQLCQRHRTACDMVGRDLSAALALLPAGAPLPVVTLKDPRRADLEAFRQRLHAALDAARAATTQAAARLQAVQAAEAHHQAARAEAETAHARLGEALGRHDFADEAVCRAAILDVEALRRLEGELQRLTEALAAARSQVADLTRQLDEHRQTAETTGISADTLDQEPGVARDAAQGVVTQAQAAREQALATCAQLRERLEGDARQRQRAAAERETIVQQQEAMRVWHDLKTVIGDHDGSRFRRIAQSLTLDQLLELANQRLDRISPRYHLIRRSVQEGIPSLAIEVIDHDQADERRPIATLSGGETFLVSLALALALADLKRGTLAIRTLFIDEGFGTLDAATLDQALGVLERLQAEQDTRILLISHVGALQERLSHTVQVERLGAGRSRLRFVGPDGDFTPPLVKGTDNQTEIAHVIPHATALAEISPADCQTFLEAIPDEGISTRTLRSNLGWEEMRFKTVRRALESELRIHVPPGLRSLFRTPAAGEGS